MSAKVLCPCGYTSEDAKFAARHEVTGECTGPAERAISCNTAERERLSFAAVAAEEAWVQTPSGSAEEDAAEVIMDQTAEALDGFDDKEAAEIEIARQLDIAAEQDRQDQVVAAEAAGE